MIANFIINRLYRLQTRIHIFINCAIIKRMLWVCYYILSMNITIPSWYCKRLCLDFANK